MGAGNLTKRTGTIFLCVNNKTIEIHLCFSGFGGDDSSPFHYFNNFNPFTPRSDQHINSTDNSNALSSIQVMRTKKMINVTRA